MYKPVLLCILDGFGISQEEDVKNAIKTAKTPNLDEIFNKYPHTQLSCSGGSVGLPDGQMGNSEVGHTNIGAGRVVFQDYTRITNAIKDGSFYENEVLKTAMQNCLNNNSSLHIAGLLSNGGVHSHISHLFALIDMANRMKIKKIYIHCILDGRDVSPTSGEAFIKELQEKIEDHKNCSIATVVGRYYAMDRDNRFERVKIAYDAFTQSVGKKTDNPAETVLEYYKEKDEFGKNITDEFMLPIIADENGKVKDKDSFIFFNFRPDRAREITKAFVIDDFDGFERKKLDINYVCMTEYDATIKNADVAFKPEDLNNTLGQVIEDSGYNQLRIAETEKYAHVTFFFNGGSEVQNEHEDRILVPSPKVATYDLQPEMSAYIVTEKLLEAIKTQKYDLIVLNYANCDMVGHTGIFEAAVKAVEAIDECVGKVYKEVLNQGGVILLTADHGNAEKMTEKDGSPFTAHTTFPVPFVVIGMKEKIKLSNGYLSDIAPTILDIMNIPKPIEMNGKSLIER